MCSMITLRDVRFSYHDYAAIDGINLDIGNGERLSLMGPNGCGKSTLAMLIKGLINPDSGKVSIDGKPAVSAAPGKVGLVFQNPENQLVAATVEREIAFGLENIGMERPAMRRKVNETIEQFGLEEFRRYPPHKLSGGQMQKLALAAVIAMEPDWLILDEPTSLLDSESRHDFLQTLNTLPKNTGIVFITQLATEALKFPRLVVLNRGRIYFDGEPGVFFADKKSMGEAGIEPPVRLLLEQQLAE